MLRSWIEGWKKENKWKLLLDAGSLAIIVLGIGVSIYMNGVGRSLWLDEAYLVSSLENRSFLQLTASPLDYVQSAPVIYLYIVKLLMTLLGDSEWVLRLFSVFCYILTIFLSGYVSKKLFGCKYPLLCAAFVANTNFLLRYSNVFKPYVSECVWVLLVLLIYAWYREKKISWYLMIVSYMILIWAANPVCFFIGGILSCEFAAGIFEKNKEKLWHSVIGGCGIGASFLFYYFYWLRAAATDDFMQKYWINDRFPLFSLNRDEWAVGWKLIRTLFGACHKELRFLLLAMVLGGLIVGIVKKNWYGIVLAIGFFLALFASSLYRFPVRDRLWAFSFPLFAILAFYFADLMLIKEGTRRGEIFAVLILLVLVLTNSGIKTYREKDEVYWAGNETNPLIAYVQEHIQADEKVYVFYNSIPAVSYKIGYGVNRIGNVPEDNIIWATSVLAKDDLNLIAPEDKCYILTSQADSETLDPLLEELEGYGSLETVLDVYGTRLYYFCR